MEAREMEPNYVNSRIGEKIKDLRNKNGLTQQELADTFRGDTAGSD